MSNELMQTENKSLSVFSSIENFEAAKQMAVALAKSTIVPREYQNNPANCLIALEMSDRVKMPVFMIMQNTYIVNGKPGWSSSMITGLINGSRRYKGPLKFEIGGKGDTLSCYAYATDMDGNTITGPTITMAMAKAEGWIDKNGSKWKTMPEVMIRYRAASFFGRLYCSDILYGLYSSDELIEMPSDSYQVVDGEKEQANTISLDFEEFSAPEPISEAHEEEHMPVIDEDDDIPPELR
ncbi:MAG: hypothetical protein GT601_17655 [Acidaminobacter sp.]|uniref:hypothetical protein n=1 Tax=Acidaminobacter sp. TaxID=1872102 RepID=UPI001384F3A4|nr:hypothetical protein [Acidaminobacter sp.]MZQ99496.1 hypothetical protein [Acidaminobacter sp.]